MLINTLLLKREPKVLAARIGGTPLQLVENRTEKTLIVRDEELIAADAQRKLQRLSYAVSAIA